MDSVFIPAGMGGPAFALVALGGHPLFDAARADAAGVEGMPFVAAGAAPDFVAGRFPLAKGTADTRSGNARTDAGAFVCKYLVHGSFDSTERAGVSYTACRNASPKQKSVFGIAVGVGGAGAERAGEERPVFIERSAPAGGIGGARRHLCADPKLGCVGACRDAV